MRIRADQDENAMRGPHFLFLPSLRMKKKPKIQDEDELRREYDSAIFRKGVRGKYAKQYCQGTNLILLAPDVATAFPPTESVNDALRMLMKVAGSLKNIRGESN
jgi:hypothetical protein